MWKLQESHYDSDHIVTWKYMQLAMQTKRKYVTVLCNHFLHCLPHCICTLASVICIHGLVVLEAFPRTSMYLLRIHLLHVPFHFICSKILAESVGVFMLYPHLCICLYLFFFRLLQGYLSKHGQVAVYRVANLMRGEIYRKLTVVGNKQTT